MHNQIHVEELPLSPSIGRNVNVSFENDGEDAIVERKPTVDLPPENAIPVWLLREDRAQDAVDYAQHLTAAYRMMSRGVVPPPYVLRRLAELMAFPDLVGLIGHSPALADLLASSEASRRRKHPEAALRRRRRFLSAIVHGDPSVVASAVITPDVKRRAEAELRLLRLRHFQQVLRLHVGTAPASGSEAIKLILESQPPRSIAKSNRLQPPPTGRQTQIQKAFQQLRLKRCLSQICQHRDTVHSSFGKKRHLAHRVATECCKKVLSLAARQEVIRERERKERLRLLRESDLAGYMELVRQSKNEKIQELMEATAKCLRDVTKKIERQRRKTQEARIQQMKELAMDDAGTTAELPSTEVAESAPVTTVLDANFSLLGGVVSQPTILSGGTLMPYQVTGLQFLSNLYRADLSGILADEMGLGKTVQTIALLAWLMESENVFGPHLVIVPLSTLPNWESEIVKWCPNLKHIIFRGGSKRERKQLLKMSSDGTYSWNICLTTAEWVIREMRMLGNIFWTYIIVDEGHKLKNLRSKFHGILASFRSTHRLLLTGTPLQNSLTDLWALLHYLLPSVFNSHQDFDTWFGEPFRLNTNTKSASSSATDEATQLNEEESFLLINRLHSLLRPFLLRREKKEVLGDLPEKIEYIVKVPLSKWQELLYNQISNRAISEDWENASAVRLSNIVMQLRKVANHPYLFEDEYHLDDDIIRSSGKFEVLDRMLMKLVAQKHKTLIFCQMTQLMDVLDDYLQLRGINRCRLDGSTSLEARAERCAAFNDPNNNDLLIFVLSTRAGGLGLNLQAADTVIIFDSDWNPHQDLQAQARAHRLGQENEVRVFRLVTASGVEEGILERARKKLDIDVKIIQAGRFDARTAESERHEHLRSLLLNSNRGPSEQQVTSPVELNRWLARSAEEEKYNNQCDLDLFGAENFKPLLEEDEPGDVVEGGTTMEDDTLSSPPSSARATAVETDILFTSTFLERTGRLVALDEVPEALRRQPPEKGNEENQLLPRRRRTMD